MNSASIVIEAVYQAESKNVWKALTDPSEMKEWYFDIPSFKAEKGTRFQFSGGSAEKTYLHLCEVKEAIKNERLSYSWKYANYPGDSLVSFQLVSEGMHTRLMFSHTGLDSFPKDNPDFARGSFFAGWTTILGENLKNYVEKQSA